MYGPSRQDVNFMIGLVVAAAILAGVAMFCLGRCTAGYSVDVDIKAVQNGGKQ